MSKDITDELISREETSGYSFEKENSIEELKRLFYTDRLTQYGKRKLIEYYEKQIKEQNDIIKTANIAIKDLQEKLKNYIPVSLVEETIEELNNSIDLAIDNSKGGLDEEFIEKGSELLAQKKVLQELLEKR